MRKRLDEVIDDIAKRKLPLPKADVSEIVDFLRWVGDANFPSLGYRESPFSGEGDQVSYRIVDDASLGILRDFNTRIFDGIRNRDNMPPDVRNFIRQPNLMMVTKANLHSTVHRNVHLDSIVMKLFSAKGEVIGERLFAGLFTSIAYNRSPSEIPLLRRKVETVIKRAGFSPQSHDGKALVNILETYPRDELFQSNDDELLDTAVGILHLQERQRIALFARRDPYERFVSALVYLPRDTLNTALRLRIGGLLSKAFGGQVAASYVHVGDGSLARLQYILNTVPGEVPAVDLKMLEAEIVEASRSWRDKLHDALVEAKGEAKGIALLRRFGDAFPAGYEEYFNAFTAVHDIERVEEALRQTAPALNLYRPIEEPASALRLKTFNDGVKIALSTVLPSLENFGLKVISENPFDIQPSGVETVVWIHDFAMVTADGADFDIGQIRDNFQGAYAKIWAGEMEDDGFNRLIISAGLAWRDCTL